MKDDFFALLPGVILLFACLVCCVCVMYMQNKEISEVRRKAALTEMSYQIKAITLGYAEFDRTNGNWQWLTNR